MVASAFLIALGYGIIAPLLPQFVVSFDVSMAAAGLVVAVFSGARLAFAPMSGAWIDRFGSRSVYLSGLLIVAVSTGCVALAQEYWHVLAMRAIAGIGSTMFTVAAMGLIVRISPPDIRGRCSALYGTAFLLGNVFGPLLGSALSFLGFHWPFVIYGCGVACAALVVAVMMPRGNEVRVAARALPPMTLGQAFQDHAFRAALTSNFAHVWINLGVRVSVLPLFAAAIFGAGGQEARGMQLAGLALAAFAAGNAVVLQFSGRLADGIGRRPLILCGLVGTGICVALLGLSTAAWSLLLTSTLAGAASGLINPAQQAAIADVVGNERSGGKVLSAFQMAGDLGQIMGPIFIGALADAYGFPIAFAACSVVAALGVVAWLAAPETLGRGAASVEKVQSK